MVAKITFPKSVKAALNYNEKKVQSGQADCLHASNFLLEADDMNFYQKLATFERLNALNDRATTKTIHISLNFDPSENISAERLKSIANGYMEKIGFGNQPFLVYKHKDAGHPHIHIVSTTIQNDGKRINTHNIGRNQSEAARKAIEQQFGLVKAEQQKRMNPQAIKSVDNLKILYGAAETKRSIANVVSAVYQQYSYTSLPEYNAILRQFNVVADRGTEQGKIYKNNGLVYRILDPNGIKVGVPIKASSIACQPTLQNLEKKFITNESDKKNLLPFMRSKLDKCLATAPHSMEQLKQRLVQKDIYTLLRQNEKGHVYGITFVDNKNKVVFNGSELGKGYSITALQTKIANAFVTTVNATTKQLENQNTATIEKNKPAISFEKNNTVHQNIEKSLTISIPAKESVDYPPQLLLKKKRKKKKKKTEQ